MIKQLFLLILLMLPVVNLAAEDMILSAKNLVFSMDDRTGNFFMENPNPRSRSFRDLLFRDNPPTSYLTVIINNKPYKLSELKQETPYRMEGNSIRSEFSKDKVTVRVIYQLTNLAGTENDTLLAIVAVRNPTFNQIGTGARFLLDTAYGESQKRPAIFSDGGERIDYDRILRKENMPIFLMSGFMEPDTPEFGYGLFIYPVINEMKPSSILIGNWKKLDEKELTYPLDPLAKFRYNQFSNPDASVAVFYQDIFIKTGEEIAFGVALSVNKIPVPGAVFFPALTYFTPPMPVIPGMPVPGAAETNAPATEGMASAASVTGVTNAPLTVGMPTLSNQASLTNVSVMVVTNDLLSAQRELLEKLSQLIDRLDGKPSDKAPEKKQKAQSSFRKGLDRSLNSGIPGDPFADEKYYRGQDEQKTQSSSAAAASYPTPAPAPRDADRQPVYEPRFQPTIQLTSTNVMVTNILEGADPRELERLKRDQGKLQEEYSGKLGELEEYYKKLLKKQEEEYKAISGDYKSKMEQKEKRKTRNERLEQIDNTIREIDQKVGAMEALLQLNLDFESMPPEKLDELKKALESIERSLPVQ